MTFNIEMEKNLWFQKLRASSEHLLSLCMWFFSMLRVTYCGRLLVGDLLV